MLTLLAALWRAVSALRLPAHPHLPGARGSRHELVFGLVAVAAAAVFMCRSGERASASSATGLGRWRLLAPIKCDLASSSSTDVPTCRS